MDYFGSDAIQHLHIFFVVRNNSRVLKLQGEEPLSITF